MCRSCRDSIYVYRLALDLLTQNKMRCIWRQLVVQWEFNRPSWFVPSRKQQGFAFVLNKARLIEGLAPRPLWWWIFALPASYWRALCRGAHACSTAAKQAALFCAWALLLWDEDGVFVTTHEAKSGVWDIGAHAEEAGEAGQYQVSSLETADGIVANVLEDSWMLVIKRIWY